MIRIVKLSFEATHVDKFVTLFEERKHLIRNFEGCSLLELWQDKQDPNVFYTYSLWQNENHLKQYRMSDLFQDTWRQVKPWFKCPAQAFSADKIRSLI
jgi:quinol monooxygenase YgiN